MLKYIFLFVYVLIDFFITFKISLNLPQYNVLIFLGLFFSSVVIPLFFCLKKISLFEPFFWFSLYYFLLIVSAYIEVSSNFTNSSLIVSTYFYNNIYYIFLKTIWLILVSYLVFSFAYFLVRPKIIIFNINSKLDNVSFNLIKLIAFFSLLIALGNFLYNLYILTKFNIIKYFLELAYYSGYMRKFGLTTIGYNFIYVSMFLYTYLYINKKISYIYFILVVSVYIMIILSLGRITNTATSIMILYLTILYFKNKKFYIEGKLFLKVVIFMLMIIFLFFYRMYTSYLRAKGISFEEFFNIILPASVKILVGEGNLPNVGILMKIIDSWQQDIGFLYGKSLFVGFSIFLPHSISKEIILHNTVSWLSKFQWYTHIHGGSLPPTVIGDLFANFGIGGVIVGMFILGLLFSLLYKHVVKKGHYFIFIFYLFFLLKFVFILPKGEFSRLSFILIPILILISYLIVKLITIAIRRSKV